MTKLEPSTTNATIFGRANEIQPQRLFAGAMQDGFVRNQDIEPSV